MGGSGRKHLLHGAEWSGPGHSWLNALLQSTGSVHPIAEAFRVMRVRLRNWHSSNRPVIGFANPPPVVPSAVIHADIHAGC